MGLLDGVAGCTSLEYLNISFQDRIPVVLEKTWLVDRLVRPLRACSPSLKYVKSPEAKACWELGRSGGAELRELSLEETERIERCATDGTS